MNKRTGLFLPDARNIGGRSMQMENKFVHKFRLNKVKSVLTVPTVSEYEPRLYRRPKRPQTARRKHTEHKRKGSPYCLDERELMILDSYHANRHRHNERIKAMETRMDRGLPLYHSPVFGKQKRKGKTRKKYLGERRRKQQQNGLRKSDSSLSFLPTKTANSLREQLNIKPRQSRARNSGLSKSLGVLKNAVEELVNTPHRVEATSSSQTSRAPTAARGTGMAKKCASTRDGKNSDKKLRPNSSRGRLRSLATSKKRQTATGAIEAKKEGRRKKIITRSVLSRKKKTKNQSLSSVAAVATKTLIPSALAASLRSPKSRTKTSEQGGGGGGEGGGDIRGEDDGKQMKNLAAETGIKDSKSQTSPQQSGDDFLSDSSCNFPPEPEYLLESSVDSVSMPWGGATGPAPSATKKTSSSSSKATRNETKKETNAVVEGKEKKSINTNGSGSSSTACTKISKTTKTNVKEVAVSEAANGAQNSRNSDNGKTGSSSRDSHFGENDEDTGRKEKSSTADSSSNSNSSSSSSSKKKKKKKKNIRSSNDSTNRPGELSTSSGPVSTMEKGSGSCITKEEGEKSEKKKKKKKKTKDKEEEKTKNLLANSDVSENGTSNESATEHKEKEKRGDDLQGNQEDTKKISAKTAGDGIGVAAPGSTHSASDLGEYSNDSFVKEEVGRAAIETASAGKETKPSAATAAT